MPQVQRGELWAADLDSPNPLQSRGHVRPVLVLQTNGLNEAAHPTTIVIPAGTPGQPLGGAENFPLRVRLPRGGGLADDVELLVDQIRAIDNQRLLQRLQILPPAVVGRVEQALLLLVGP